MKIFGREKVVEAPERRKMPRTRVDCMALLILPSGNVPGRLFDISDMGARITCEHPPSKGVAVILDWPYGEAYGKITWSKPGMCGVQFDRALTAEKLKETIESAPPSGPRLVHSSDEGAPANTNAPPRLFC